MKSRNGQNMSDSVFLIHFFHFFIQACLFSQKHRAHRIAVILSQMTDQFLFPAGSHSLKKVFNFICLSGNNFHLFCPDQAADSLLFIIKFLIKISRITG